MSPNLIPEIPYDKIDPEIRELVLLMNEIPGIRTVGSCAGHGPPNGYVEGSVIFQANDQGLPAFIGKLPPLHIPSGGHVASRRLALAIRYYPNEPNPFYYVLLFGGFPRARQRTLIQSLVKNLAPNI